MPETRLAINPGLQSCTAFVTPANASLSPAPRCYLQTR